MSIELLQFHQNRLVSDFRRHFFPGIERWEVAEFAIFHIAKSKVLDLEINWKFYAGSPWSLPLWILKAGRSRATAWYRLNNFSVSSLLTNWCCRVNFNGAANKPLNKGSTPPKFGWSFSDFLLAFYRPSERSLSGAKNALCRGMWPSLMGLKSLSNRNNTGLISVWANLTSFAIAL